MLTLREEIVRREDIRTMEKDIARLQREGIKKGISPKEAAKLRLEKERKRKKAGEAQLIREKEIRRGEGEQREKEEKELQESVEKEKLEVKEREKRIEEERKKKEEIAAAVVAPGEQEAVTVEQTERKREEGGRKIIEAERLKMEEKEKRAEEEKKRREEILEKEKPEIKREVLLKKREEVKKEKDEFEEEYKKLAEEKRPLESEKITISEKLKEIEEKFQVILSKEQKTEERLKLVEEKERTAQASAQKKKIEKERWKLEEERRELEKERWPWDEKIKQTENQLNEINFKAQKIEARAGELVEKQKDILEREERINLGLRKINLEGDLQKLDILNKSLEKERVNLSPGLNKIEQNLKAILVKEEEVEGKKKLIEEEEKKVKELAKKRDLEKERWGIEEKRRKVEAERWRIEEKKQETEKQTKKIEGRIETLLEKRNNITEKIKEIEQKLRGEKEPPAPSIPPPAPSVSPSAPPSVPPQGIGLEEERIKKARERITALKKETEERKRKEGEKREKVATTEIKAVDEGEKRRKEILERLREEKKEVKKPPPPTRPQEVVRVLPKKPTLKEKLWVRLLIVSLVVILTAGILTFGYYLITRERPSPVAGCTSDADCLEGQFCNPEGVCEEKGVVMCTSDADCLEGHFCNPEGSCEEKKPGLVIPAALFMVENERHLTISGSSELSSSLGLVLHEWYETSQFTRLIIENTGTNEILGLKELFEGLLIRVPGGFYQKIENDFILFIYSQPEGNRLGFVAEIKNYEGLANLLGGQETTMESDYEDFFKLMGYEGTSPEMRYFKNAVDISGYTGPNFRFQSLTGQDLGILYLTAGDYFVFTSSWESMEKTIEKLGIIGIRLEITTDLEKGDEGYEVKLLQTWLTEEGIYSGAVGGHFGPLTEAAVIRFQERYASEVLAPQGKSKGTGVVDSYTREKLNELYEDSGIKPQIDELTIVGLMFGDNGEEVKLLQSWLKEEGIYRGAVGGHFRRLTEMAVIEFQERYASEILVPQGLPKGTGIVDELTLKKLNELYSGH